MHLILHIKNFFNQIRIQVRSESELEGPSLRNSFGFNATEMNLAEAQINSDVIFF